MLFNSNIFGNFLQICWFCNSLWLEKTLDVKPNFLDLWRLTSWPSMWSVWWRFCVCWESCTVHICWYEHPVCDFSVNLSILLFKSNLSWLSFLFGCYNHCWMMTDVTCYYSTDIFPEVWWCLLHISVWIGFTFCFIYICYVSLSITLSLNNIILYFLRSIQLKYSCQI